MPIPHSGQKTIAAAGTAEALGEAPVGGPLLVKALAANTGKVYVGNDGAGDVSSTNGFELSPGDPVVFQFVSNLANIRVDAAVNGEGVSWICLEI